MSALKSARGILDCPAKCPKGCSACVLVADLSARQEIVDRRAAHGRRLTIGYDDGSAAVVLFDQGFGSWRSARQDDHPFRASPEEQARSLLHSSVLVGGNGDGCFAVTRAEGST